MMLRSRCRIVRRDVAREGGGAREGVTPVTRSFERFGVYPKLHPFDGRRAVATDPRMGSNENPPAGGYINRVCISQEQSR
ncbi:hypothetical protein PS862_04474 [Pseudomonas fluorescens]|uniref:Uncharacterized protein n=1 Tax=Pseudomonas fluorescens TaxID=294 RepID=A0A5E6TSC4_PSEFL|nr:hypothetical protein PS639_03042 [Pseudomonas fluorescens]VVP33029.1 hypothetical protein PS862_04474 [Pseudomonas fluorescens]